MPTTYIDGQLQSDPLPSPATWIDGILQPAEVDNLLTVYTAAENTDQITPSVVIDGAYTGAPLLWDFGDGVTSTDHSATHTYTGTGPGGVWPVTLGPAEMLPFVTTFDMNDDMVTDALAQVAAKLPNLENLILYANPLAINIPPEIGSMLALETLWLAICELVGEIPPEIGNLTNLTTLKLQANQLSGLIPPELGNLPAVDFFWLGENLLTGDIPSELGNLTTATSITLHLNQFADTEVGAYNVATIETLLLQSNAMSESEVDSAITEVYANRANYTDATPSLNVGGTNATPSGVYQDATPPTTGLEMIYKLANDPDAEGFNTWTVTWNGGSAP